MLDAWNARLGSASPRNREERIRAQCAQEEDDQEAQQRDDRRIMARLTPAQKDIRVLKLLIGLRNPRILGPLVARGFRLEDAEEGWRLLREVGRFRFDVMAPPKPDPRLIAQLDHWENTWFPVADATLNRHFPEVHKRVFLNLSQTEGPAVIVSVGALLDRITALEGGGTEDREARQLLVRRGLTDTVLEEARLLLDTIGKTELNTAVPDLEADRADMVAARGAMWSWYLEWSRIARGVIRDGNLLRELGFKSVGQEADDAEQEE